MTTTTVTAPERPKRRRTSGGVLFALVLGLAVVLAACSDETKDQIRDSVGSTPPEETAPPESAPPEETAPPETTPPETAPPETAPPEEEDEFSDEDWIILIVLIAAVVLLIIGVTSAATRHSERKQAATAALARRTRGVTGSAQWIHDQGSLDVLRASDPAQLQANWARVRGSSLDLENQITAFSASIDDTSLENTLAHLGRQVASLRGSLEAYVSLRLDDTPSEPLIENATQTVMDRRRQLDATLQTAMMR